MNDRYVRRIQYKVALDKEWKEKGRGSIYATDYERTLREAKLAGFKVFRNEKGDHRLEERYENNHKVYEMIADVFAGRRGQSPFY